MSRRGYDPAEVDAHLSAVADEVVELQATPRGGDTLASSASDHVRAIVEAAESSAAQIRREAESQADAMRQRAEQHAAEVWRRRARRCWSASRRPSASSRP